VKILEIDTNDVSYVKWYGFNEKEYYINNREDINNFIETLKNHNYIKKQDNDAEGCYLVEIGCSNGIIDCGIDDDLFSINGVQYSLEEGSLSGLTEYMRSKMD